MLQLLIPIMTKVVGGLFKSRETSQALKKIREEGSIILEKHKVKAKIIRAQSDADSAGDLDKLAVGQKTWMDEILAVIIMIPVVMSFIPGLVGHVEAGFLALQGMPEYMMYLIGGVYIFYFGYKRILLLALQGYLGKNKLMK